MTDFITDFILSLLPITVISFWTCRFVVKSLRYLALYYDSLATNLFKQSCCRLRASFSPDWTSIHFFSLWSVHIDRRIGGLHWVLCCTLFHFSVLLLGGILGTAAQFKKWHFALYTLYLFFACLYSLETWAIFLKECLFTFWRKSGNYLVQFTYLMFILEVVCYIN